MKVYEVVYKKIHNFAELDNMERISYGVWAKEEKALEILKEVLREEIPVNEIDEKQMQDIEDWKYYSVTNNAYYEVVEIFVME